MKKLKLNESKKKWLPNTDPQNPRSSTEATLRGRSEKDEGAAPRAYHLHFNQNNSTPICFTYWHPPKISLEERIWLLEFENHYSRNNSRFL